MRLALGVISGLLLAGVGQGACAASIYLSCTPPPSVPYKDPTTWKVDLDERSISSDEGMFGSKFVNASISDTSITGLIQLESGNTVFVKIDRINGELTYTISYAKKDGAYQNPTVFHYECNSSTRTRF